MNFALKAEVARTFLDSAGIPYLSAHSDKQLSAADVGDIGRPLTVLIECSDQTRESGPAKEPAQAAVPPQETTQFNYRVTQNLFLRSEPDKSSLNMLTNYAPDYIPEETIFTWKNRPGASICTVGRGGEIWCQITYTHDGGIQTVGWVSAHFLRSTITNTLLACLFQNSDPDCAPPPSSLYLKCTPTVIASEPDPITSISVGLIRQGSQISSFDAWHHSAKGNIYKRSEQYVDRHFQIPNVQEPHWLWEGRWNKDLNVYMIGQLAALARVYTYKEWIFHGDPVPSRAEVTSSICTEVRQMADWEQPGPPSAQYTTPDHPVPTAGTYFTVGDVAFLTGPGAQYAPIGPGRLPPQSAVQWQGVCRAIIDSQAQVVARWCQVTYGGLTGWVPAYYLIDGNGWRLSCMMSPPTPSCVENAHVQLE